MVRSAVLRAFLMAAAHRKSNGIYLSQFLKEHNLSEAARIATMTEYFFQPFL
jgi:hypothetical protein